MKIIQISYLGLGVLVIYLSTFIDFEIKNVEIPITGQSLAVLVMVYLLPKKWGLYAIITYVIIGILGLPVFADATFGIETIKGNSGGYIYGFIFAAWVITLFKTIKKPFKLANICFGMLLGTLLILLFGYIHLSFRIGTKDAFVYGVQPFIVGGLIKVAVGTFIVWFWNKKFTSI